MKIRRHSSRMMQELHDKDGIHSFSFEILVICAKEHRFMYEGILIDEMKPEINTRRSGGKPRKKPFVSDPFSTNAIIMLKRELSGEISYTEEILEGQDISARKNPRACIPLTPLHKEKLRAAHKARFEKKKLEMMNGTD
jgi:hypothetical protein